MTSAVDVDLRRVYGAYPSGVAALAGLVNDVPVGIAASSFIPVSLDPPLVSVCVARTSSTWPILRGLPRLGISVLGADQEGVSRQLGAKIGDRFNGVSWRAATDGGVLLDAAAAWYECSIDNEIVAGDHDIVVFRVHDLDVVPGVSPLVFHASAYHRLG
jgi:flavin reductase (DIM6/NTAB) family NADH-FMN oxidoreductase RutF